MLYFCHSLRHDICILFRSFEVYLTSTTINSQFFKGRKQKSNSLLNLKFSTSYHHSPASAVDSALSFRVVGLNLVERTFFLTRERTGLFQHVYPNYSSHHHRSPASTVDSALSFRVVGLNLVDRAFFFFVFLTRERTCLFQDVYPNYSSHHHRSPASTVDSALSFRVVGLNLEDRTFFFLTREHTCLFQHVNPNYSSHHHRSLAGTVDSVLCFGARGR